jgi:hypothetical protein
LLRTTVDFTGALFVGVVGESVLVVLGFGVADGVLLSGPASAWVPG